MNGVVGRLLAAERWTILCHENPDADTLGAGLALCLTAGHLGKVAEVVCVDPAPPSLSFLPGVDDVRREPGLTDSMVIVVDAGDLARIGSLYDTHAAWLASAEVVNIDHHVSNPGYGQAAWIDAGAAATCEMVAALVPALGVPLDEDIATALLAGIVNDTHAFAHPNATPRTLRVAADLVEAGASLHRITRAIYSDRPYPTLALWGLMLAEIEQRADGRIVHTSMTIDMRRATGTELSASEGFIDLLASTRLGEVTVLFKETAPAETRVSVRTASAVDAVRIAAAFGGGGHARAAGCTVEAPLAEARVRVLEVCQRELAAVDAGRH